MKFVIILSASVLALTLASTAYAGVITNHDAQEHKLTIIEGESSKEIKLQSKQSMNAVCSSTCIIRLNDDKEYEYEMESGELVSIEGGDLYYDGGALDKGSASGSPLGAEGNK